MLRYIYGSDYEFDYELLARVNGPLHDMVYYSHLYIVADKYGVQELDEMALCDFYFVVAYAYDEGGIDEPSILEFVETLYGFEILPQILVHILCQCVHEKMENILKQEDFVEALKKFPQFSLDMMRYLANDLSKPSGSGNNSRFNIISIVSG